jgi:hypothetical protein
MDMREIGKYMINFEHNTLVLDSSHSTEDQKAINDFVAFKIDEAFQEGIEEGIVIERLRIKDLLDDYLEGPDVDWNLLMEWIDEV